jgi:hypothetical protein
MSESDLTTSVHRFNHGEHGEHGDGYGYCLSP